MLNGWRGITHQRFEHDLIHGAGGCLSLSLKLTQERFWKD